MSKEKSSDEVEPQDSSVSDASAKDPNADIYENRGSKKIIRVVTVMAYLFSVSFVGILLSAYYIFLWESPNSRLIERSRLRAEPQVQFLISEPYLEEGHHLRKKENLLPENVPNRMHKSRPLLLGRIAHDVPDDVPVDPDEASRGLATSQQRRLNAMLLKLKYSLMENLRQTRMNRTSHLSHEATSSEPDKYSFFGAKGGDRVLNSTRNSSLGYGKMPRGNVSAEKTRLDDGIGLHRKSAHFSSALSIEDPLFSTLKSAAISDIKPKQARRFSGRPVDHDVTSIIGGKARYSDKENIVEPYTVTVNEPNDPRSNHEVMTRRDSDRHGKSETTKQDENSADRRVTDNNREKDPSDSLEVTNPEKYPDSQTSCPPSVNNVNCSGRNCTDNNNECCTNCQAERIVHDKVSIDLSERSRFADDPKFHQPPDDPAVKPTYVAKFQRNSEDIHAIDLPLKDYPGLIEKKEQISIFTRYICFQSEEQDKNTNA